ncbi:MAG: AI-2E family transporter [Methyloceanibacter sp.]|uniref:AI-2E family transporter n=1 Tax=Methyloceanibacter sp. TaxID=1965321 RepID=UPI003D6CEFE8
MSPRLPLLTTSADARAATLQGLLIATIVIGALYFARDVLLPLALAILLSFVLTPPLLLLRRIKVPRVLAVAIVVGVAFAIIFGLGWLISREATQLAADLPGYQATLSQKIQSLRESTSESKVLQKAEDVLTDLQAQLDQPQQAPPAPSVGAEALHPDDKPVVVEVRQPPPTGLALYRRIAGTLLPPLATAGIVLLLVVFILLQREDLRDRLIRLFGASDLQRATSTMSDAAGRLSRYFLSQVLINAAYGTFIAVALWAIGMPSPIAWGILAMLMRFVPYVGSYIAAALPLLIAAAIDPGWTTVIMVLVLFVAGEMFMGQVVEPQVFGRGTGVTPIAVIASTIFWAWLWGPLGLLIAMPITVCLAVLGRHVEGLGFLDVLLGDEPALTPEQSFYQRALTGDAAEATYQAELCLKDQSLVAYLDRVALGGLKLAERDAARGALDGQQTERIARTVKEMLENLADFEPRRWFQRLRHKDEATENGKEGAEGLASLEAAEEDAEEKLPVIDPLLPEWRDGEPVLVIGGRSMLDEVAGAMLAAVLEKRGLGAKALGPEAISAGHITSLHNTQARLLCLSYLGLGTGPAHIRYLVKRLRRILPEGTLILVAYWQDGQDSDSVKELLDVAGADAYAATLHEAAEYCVKAAKGELKGEAEAAEGEAEKGGDTAAAAKATAAKAASAAKTPAPADKPKGKKPAARVA